MTWSYFERCGYMAGNRSCFQNTKWPAVLYILSKFHKSKKTYQISIKKSQAILNCFTDLKCSVCFTLGSENETVLCDT